jgi:hypothetical protein
VEFVTPIVRVSEIILYCFQRHLADIIQVTNGKQQKDFFTIPEYEQWLESTPDSDKWVAKYFQVCSVFLIFAVIDAVRVRVWE